MRVLAMTPEQINMLPPTERSTYIQIVSSCIFIYHIRVFNDCLLGVFFFCRELLWVFRQDEKKTLGRKKKNLYNQLLSSMYQIPNQLPRSLSIVMSFFDPFFFMIQCYVYKQQQKKILSYKYTLSAKKKKKVYPAFVALSYKLHSLTQSQPSKPETKLLVRYNSPTPLHK